MKLYVIYRPKDETFLGQEYEKPYSYSEWASGGDCYNTVFSKLPDLLEKEEMKLLIFETKKAASGWIKKSGYDFKLVIKNISEL